MGSEETKASVPPTWRRIATYLTGQQARWLLALLLLVTLIGVALLLPWILPWFYWDANPTTVFMSPPPENLNITQGAGQLVAPKIIHHRWNDENIPERWKAVRERCMAMHPDYEFMLWTEEKERELLKEHYPWFLHNYDHYTYTIQQADIGRYFFLHKYGGLYLDLDVECLRRVDYLLTHEIVLPLTWPVGFSNDVLVTPAGHPFYDQVTKAAPKWDRWYGTKYPTVMFSTGPMFLTYQAMLYPNKSGITVLPRMLYGKYAHNLDIAFFDHYHASMWHSTDAAVFLFFWRLRLPIVLAAVLVIGWHMRRQYLLRQQGMETIAKVL